MSETEQTKLKTLVASIDNVYGKGSFRKFDDNFIENVETISSGSVTLDIALGVGGYPKGRIIEIFGPEGSGKTTLVLHLISEAQKEGIRCAFIDMEHSLDIFYASNLGINAKDLYFSQPDNGEQALQIVQKIVTSGLFGVVVVDSVAALVPKAEIEGEMGDAVVGLQARLMSQAMRMLAGPVKKNNCILAFTNQLREKIGIIYGSPEVTTGGNALKFYSTVRLDIRRISFIKDGEQTTGGRTKVKIIKNKIACPFKVAEFDIVYGKGICKIGEIIDLGVQIDIIKKSGSWFSYEDSKLGQGREAVISLFKENSELYEEVKSKIYSKLFK